MIMIVSNYDGALLNGKQTLIENIEAIKEFRKESNLFVIATERNFYSIKQEIELYKIPYDYLICNNGSVILDNNYNILNYKSINEETLKEILKYFEMYKMQKPILYDTQGKVHSKKNVVELSAFFHSTEEFRKFRQFLLDNYPDVCIYKTYNQIFIRSNCFKDYGIDYICSVLDNKPKEIYTVGNSKKDLEMLKRFKGYLIYNSYFRDSSLEKCISVKQLIKKVM